MPKRIRLNRKKLKRKKEIRQKKVRQRKNFLPMLLLIVLSWSGVFFTVYLMDPSTPGAIPLFLLLVFLSLLFTLSTFFANTRRGFVASSALTFFLILRYLEIGNVLNFTLLTGIAIAAEFYFSKTR